MYFITISRTLGSGGNRIAAKLSRQTGLPVIDRQTTFDRWLPQLAGPHELHMLQESYAFYHHETTNGMTYKDFLIQKLQEALASGPKIFIGMGSQVVFRNHPGAIHLRIDAPIELRIENLMEEYGTNRNRALDLIQESDRRRKKYIRKVHGENWEDPLLYTLMINTDRIDDGHILGMLYPLIEEIEDETGYNQNQLSIFTQTGFSTQEFRHDIEAEFAHILDSYGIRWKYEPTTFPLELDDEGNVTSAISPDFYLVDEDTYVELTVMNPKYMAEKRKKIREFKRLYPDLKIILLGKKDLQSFMVRFKLKRHQ